MGAFIVGGLDYFAASLITFYVMLLLTPTRTQHEHGARGFSHAGAAYRDLPAGCRTKGTKGEGGGLLALLQFALVGGLDVLQFSC